MNTVDRNNRRMVMRRVIKYGQVVGGNYHRVALCVNGEEIDVAHVDGWGEAVKWAQDAWDKRKAEIGEKEIKRLGWVKPELRYWL
jgi:hypothetical protein